MDSKLYIDKFIRDDGATLSFDSHEIYLSEDNTLLARPNPDTTSIEYTEMDGGEMIRQRNSSYEQEIKGLIVPKVTDYWVIVSGIASFFQNNHTYKIIYKKANGDRFSIDKAWISTGLQIVPTPYEKYSEWSISMTIGGQNWREYSEDSTGKETYSNYLNIPLLTASTGGETWDDTGLVSDNVGEVWQIADGGIQSVYINSTKTIYPVWTVVGPCVNPKLQNNTTDTIAEFEGTVASGQKLVVDFEDGSARLDGALVSRYVYGMVYFNPGDNLVGFNSDGGESDSSTIFWNNIIN